MRGRGGQRQPHPSLRRRVPKWFAKDGREVRGSYGSSGTVGAALGRPSHLTRGMSTRARKYPAIPVAPRARVSEICWRIVEHVATSSLGKAVGRNRDPWFGAGGPPYSRP